MPPDHREILTDAIQHNKPVQLSLPSAGLVRHFKSRFLNAADDSGVWIESVISESSQLKATGEPCEISFVAGSATVSFAGSILKYEERFKLNDDSCVPAILISVPQQIDVTQRRSTYRVKVPDQSDLRVRVWRIAEGAPLEDVPAPMYEMKAEAKNICVFGIGLILSPAYIGQSPRLIGDQRLRLEVEYQDKRLVLEGRVRQTTPHGADAAQVWAGVQFVSLETDAIGRRNLSAIERIVGQLQNAELRRHRARLSA